MRQGPAFTATEPSIGGTSRIQVFHVLADSPCPYLPGRRERKVITELAEPDAQGRYEQLSRAGFRRSHHFVYRPACPRCTACVPVRVPVEGFRPGSSLRRVARRNADLRAEQRPPRASLEQYDLFSRYIASRHSDGEMAGMRFTDYRCMVEDTPVDTRIVEFRDPDGKLIAACLADWLSDGPSAVYSWFDPAQHRRSVGSYTILWLIECARRSGQAHAYLGYWIRESPKMAYKARFHPLEALGPDGWQPIHNTVLTA